VIDWRTRQGFPAAVVLDRRPGGQRIEQSNRDRGAWLNLNLVEPERSTRSLVVPLQYTES
jgi:hypothetical protein